MIKRFSLFIALLLAVSSALSQLGPIPVIPIVYTAVRIGSQSYALSTLAEMGQSLIGQFIKGLDASLTPVAEAGIVSGVRIPTAANAGSVVPAPAAAASVSTQTFYYVGTTSCARTSGGMESAQCYAAMQTATNQNSGQWYTMSANSCSSTTCTLTQYWVDSYWGPEKADTVLNHPIETYIGCAAGYTQSGGLCNLTNARAAVPDGKADWQRTGTAFSKYAGDDASTMDAWLSQQTISSTNDTLVISGMDTGQRPQKTAVTNTADGGSTITGITQKVDGSGATYTQTTVLTVNPSGVVTSAATTSQAQQMTQNPSTKTWTISAAPTSTYAPVATAGSSSTFPSDYARQGEAASAAASINATLGPKLDKLVETSAAPADLTVPDPSGYTGFGTTFQSLLGWQLPGHTSQCPTAAFNTPWNTSYTIDSHCQLITNHWSALQAAMAVVWTIVALFIVLRA